MKDEQEDEKRVAERFWKTIETTIDQKMKKDDEKRVAERFWKMIETIFYENLIKKMKKMKKNVYSNVF